MRIGIDLGGSHVGVGLVEEDGKILVKKEYNLLVKEKQRVQEVIIDKIVQFVNEILDENHHILENMKQIGIASPGTVKDGKLYHLVNLNIDEFDITEKLNEYFNIPIKICNDAKCAAIAENLYGSMKSYEDHIFLTIGTGIGGAAFYNHQMLVPKQNPGFEFGHMIIQKDGNVCKCGKQGCFESYCSIRALKKQVTSYLQLEPDISGKELRKLIEENIQDPGLDEILERYVEYLSIGLSNLINIFEPQAIGIGGSFAHYEELLLERLKERLYRKDLLFNKNDVVEIRLATLQNDAGIIGAAML